MRPGPPFWYEESEDEDRDTHERKIRRYQDLAMRSAQVLSNEVTEEDDWDDVRKSITAIVIGIAYSIGRAYGSASKEDAHPEWDAYLKTFVDGVNRGWSDTQKASQH